MSIASKDFHSGGGRVADPPNNHEPSAQGKGFGVERLWFNSVAITSAVLNIAFDCSDPYALAGFWSLVTGCPISEEDDPGDPEASVALRNGTRLWFNRVPEAKTVKNRVHVCLRPDSLRDPEVVRLLGVGATMVADRRKPDGTGWAVLADPEGNEFCVLRSAGEHS